MAGADRMTNQHQGESAMPSGGSAPDGVNDEVWQRLADIMIAANRGDPDTCSSSCIAMTRRSRMTRR